MRSWRDKGEDGGLPWVKPSPHWMITYADMVTLLLCMFVLLFAMTSLNQAKFKQAVASVTRALGAEFLMETLEETAGEPVTWDLPQLDAVEKSLREYLSGRGIAADVIRQERGLVVRFADSTLFDRGSADIGPDGTRMMKALSGFLSGIPNHVRVEGHTCDLPIRTERYRSNWELSTARATAVLHILANEVPPERLSAAGYGEYRPVVPNTNERNRSKNRRVDVVILRMSLAKGEPPEGGKR